MQLEHLRGFVGAAQAVAEDAQRFELVGREAHHTPTGQAPVPRGEYGQNRQVTLLGFGRKTRSV